MCKKIMKTLYINIYSLTYKPTYKENHILNAHCQRESSQRIYSKFMRNFEINRHTYV